MNATFEVFTAVKIQVEISWVVISCGVVGGYRNFGRPCCLVLRNGVITQKISTWISNEFSGFIKGGRNFFASWMTVNFWRRSSLC